jgi:hypothetical protein
VTLWRMPMCARSTLVSISGCDVVTPTGNLL